MKIAIVTDAWRPQINGVVTTYLETIRILEKRGHEVQTITPQQFRTIRCPTYPEITLSLTRPNRMRNYLAGIAPHAVHIATEGPLGWAARRACLAAGFPYTTAYHTRFPEYIRLRFPIPLRLSYSVMRRFHNYAVGMMVATKQLKIELEEKGFHNVQLWTRGVNTRIFKPKESGLSVRGQYTFTFVGRVAPEKNIEAFLSLDLPGRKQVIGDGPSLADLRERFPRVSFTGYQQGRELAELLASSTVFVFPSLTDTFGVVQLEAMACGVPVAAYPVSGPRSVITNGLNGWMDKDLRTAVLRCLEIDPRKCRRFAESFSWEECTSQFIANLVMQPEQFPQHHNCYGHYA